MEVFKEHVDLILDANLTFYHPKDFENEFDIPKKEKSKSSKNVNLDKYKKQCEDLGFKPKTEKFGECVLRLLEAAN